MSFYKDLKDQELLLPLNIRNLIPENHICFLVDEIVVHQYLSPVFGSEYHVVGQQ